MSTANLDSADLKAVAAGGWLREDVMRRIIQIDDIDLPFTNRVGTDSVSQSYTEWAIKELAAPSVTNKVVDGADTTGNDTKTGLRVGNHCQESVKVVRVSDRAVASTGIDYANELAEQVKGRSRELRRDLEATALTMQGSVADDGNSTAGQTAGVFAWIITNINAGATGTHAGFQAGTKLVTAGTAGTKRALSEAYIDAVSLGVYNNGGDDDDEFGMMMRPAVKVKISDYGYGTDAKIAALQRQVSGRDGQAIGSIDYWRTDFGYLELIPNRLQQTTAAATSTIGIFNFSYLKLGFLKNYYVKPLATTGLAENRLMAVDWCVKVLNEKSQGAIYDVDEAVAMVV